MSVQKPDDWPRVFEEQLNAGNLDGVAALYDPDARFVAPSGDIIVGRDGIRPVLAELIRTKTRFRSRVVKSIAVDDIALVCTDFHGTSVDSAGKTIAADSR